MIFGAFDLHDEFFAKHQLNYLADIVRVLHYTGKRFNFYDVMVMALDQSVIEEQVAAARWRMARDPEISTQRRLNFEMSAKNLFQSFGDRERIPKIQGLLNECMTFLDDELSVITGPYDNLLSINDVIDNELILFVSLNINKNTAPVRALGKMMLQNLQLVVGKRYETETERKRRNKPLFSVVMDEFAPFGYRNFAQILNTAQGTNTAFLFSLQSLPQLLEVGKGFQQDVSSAPGTTMLMQTRDEETAKYFKQASSQVPVQKRTQQLWRKDFLGFERYDKAIGASEREQLEFRALDHHIKNLGKGKMEVLMTDPIQGTLHGRLHVRLPSDVRVPLTPPKYRTMFFRSTDQGTLALNGKQFPQPPLVWRVSGRELWVRAMHENVRPNSTTKLFVAPYFNVNGEDGLTCQGTMRTPEDFGVEAIPLWEQAFFQSEFTHQNGTRRLTSHPDGFLGLWTSLSRSRKPFPVQHLAAANQTLLEFVMHESS